MKEKLHTIQHKLSDLWVVGAFALCLFYMDNGYFNLLEAKASIVELEALVFCGMSALCLLGLLYISPVAESVKLRIKNIKAMDIGICIWGAMALLSVAVSPYKEAAFSGSYGWSVGAGFYLAMVLVYLFLSPKMEMSAKLWWLAGAAVTVEAFWVVLNGFYIDPLELHAHLMEKDYVRYVATVGNTNWYVGFMALVMPFFYMGVFALTKLWQRILVHVALFICAMSLITINCQGVYLSVFAMMAMGIWYSLGDDKRLCQVMFHNGIVCLAPLVVWGISQIFTMVPTDGITRQLLKPQVSGLLTAFWFICCLLVKKRGRILIGKKRVLRMAFFVLAGVFVIIIGLRQWSVFDNDWGTNRGRIWKTAIQVFKGLPLPNKVFGGGMNCFGYYYKAVTGSDWVRNAHNEVLEYLVCTGMAGLFCYLSVVVLVIKEKTNEDPVLIAGKTAITAYFCQALVNNPQAMNLCIFFTILALYRRKSILVV